MLSGKCGDMRGQENTECGNDVATDLRMRFFRLNVINHINNLCDF